METPVERLAQATHYRNVTVNRNQSLEGQVAKSAMSGFSSDWNKSELDHANSGVTTAQSQNKLVAKKLDPTTGKSPLATSMRGFKNGKA